MLAVVWTSWLQAQVVEEITSPILRVRDLQSLCQCGGQGRLVAKLCSVRLERGSLLKTLLVGVLTLAGQMAGD